MSRASKYNARRAHSNLWRRDFHSQAEARYADQLFADRQDGAITCVEFQVPVKLAPYLSMRVDFKFWDFRETTHSAAGEWVWCEFKGFATDTWRIQRNAWAAGLGPGWYRVVKAVRSKMLPYSIDNIWPEGKVYVPPDEVPKPHQCSARCTCCDCRGKETK